VVILYGICAIIEGQIWRKNNFMKKAITKVTACSVIIAMAISALTVDVKASSILPAAGIAASTGVGSTLSDITAKKARALAKEQSAKIHAKVTVPNQVALSANTNETTEEVADNSNTPADEVIKAPALLDDVAKVETPSSKIYKASQESNAGAKSATIEVTDNNATNDGAVKLNTNSSLAIAEATASTISDEASTVTVSADAAVPDISIRPEEQEVAEGEEDLSTKIIAQVDGYVNVRETPDEEAEVVGKLYNNSAGEWLSKEGDWYKISSGNVVGYVKGEYVVAGQAAVKLAAEVGIRTATVHTTTLKVRAEASLDSAVLGLIPDNDQLTVLEETDEWAKVSIEEGDGWISKEFVTITTEFPKAESKAEEEARLKKEQEERNKANAAAKKATKNSTTAPAASTGSYAVSGGSGLGAQVASYGLQFVGNPYVYGGTSLTNGTDCSGFTMGVYRNFGVSLPHSSGAQRSVGYAVGSLAEAQPGDIICYSGHVAIYIGGGQIVHASTAKTGIKVSNASYRQILAIRRIF